MEKCMKRVMLMWVMVLIVMMNSTTVNAAVRIAGADTNAVKKSWNQYTKKQLKSQYQRHKIFVNNIEVSNWNEGNPTGTYTFTWDKAPLAKGYQIQTQSDFGTTIRKVKGTNFKLSAPGTNYKNVTIKVRPYTRIKGKIVYGKWSGVYGMDPYCTHCEAMFYLEKKYGENYINHISEMDALMQAMTYPL